jgi:hypothetical protein
MASPHPSNPAGRETHGYNYNIIIMHVKDNSLASAQGVCWENEIIKHRTFIIGNRLTPVEA